MKYPNIVIQVSGVYDTKDQFVRRCISALRRGNVPKSEIDNFEIEMGFAKTIRDCHFYANQWVKFK